MPLWINMCVFLEKFNAVKINEELVVAVLEWLGLELDVVLC